MRILRKLYENLIENKATGFIDKPPTHPEYPDYVKDYCYRIRYGLAVSFLLPRNIKYQELGFSFRFTSLPGAGAALSFLSIEDAEKFKVKYGLKGDVYLSRDVLFLVRIDNYSDIPCYAEITHAFPQRDIKQLDLRRYSKNLINRLEIKHVVYHKNDKLSDQDKRRSEKKELQHKEELKNIDQGIEETLPLFKELCDDVYYYENGYDKRYTTVAKGTIKKEFLKDIAKSWEITDTWNNIKDTLLIKLQARTKSKNNLEILFSDFTVTSKKVFSINGELTEFIKKSVEYYLKELSSEIFYESYFSRIVPVFEDNKGIKILVKYPIPRFEVFINKDIQYIKDRFSAIEKQLEMILNEAEEAIDKAFNSSFTVDAFDEDEE